MDKIVEIDAVLLEKTAEKMFLEFHKKSLIISRHLWTWEDTSRVTKRCWRNKAEIELYGER